jgi:hypothetical protein
MDSHIRGTHTYFPSLRTNVVHSTFRHVIYGLMTYGTDLAEVEEYILTHPSYLAL